MLMHNTTFQNTVTSVVKLSAVRELSPSIFVPLVDDFGCRALVLP